MQEPKAPVLSIIPGTSARIQALDSLPPLQKLFLNPRIEKWLRKYEQKGEVDSQVCSWEEALKCDTFQTGLSLY